MVEVVSEVKLEQNGEMAVVKVLDGGRVEVERDGSTTAFRPQHTLETVISKFSDEGWSISEFDVSDDNVPRSIQESVDEYLALHEQAELKRKMDALKKKVRPFMEENNLESIQGSHGKEIYLQEAKASNSTSRYTDYELGDIMHKLEGNLLRQVTEIRINADKLEGMLKLGKLPTDKVKEIREAKIVKMGTPRFSVRKG